MPLLYEGGSRISNQPSPTANPQHIICNIVSNGLEFMGLIAQGCFKSAIGDG
jgi:hypothetical protein